jgi:hypothetical protein
MARSLLRSALVLVVVAASPLAGCASASPPSDRASPGLTPTDDASVSCGAAFDPDPVLLADTTAAAARWSAATGCDIRVEAGGVPVQLVLSIKRPDGSDTPGAVTADLSLVEIHQKARGAQRTRTVLHEMGHALGAGHVHAHGVMSDTAPFDAVIDAPSLEEVCAHLACSAFVPEPFSPAGS